MPLSMIFFRFSSAGTSLGTLGGIAEREGNY